MAWVRMAVSKSALRKDRVEGLDVTAQLDRVDGVARTARSTKARKAGASSAATASSSTARRARRSWRQVRSRRASRDSLVPQRGIVVRERTLGGSSKMGSMSGSSVMASTLKSTSGRPPTSSRHQVLTPENR